MQDSALTQLVLPLLIVLIMFGMGLSLVVADFARVIKMPKAILAGLAGQILLMPLLAFAVALFFELSAELAIGLMILAACPGGTMSNVICHIAKANLALSVTLTALSTLICVFTTPVIIALAVAHFSQTQITDFSIVSSTVALIVITLLPLSLGLFIRHKFSTTSLYLVPYFRRFSAVFVVLMIIAICIEERNTLLSSFSSVFMATLALNLLAIGIGLLLGWLTRLSAIDGVTLGIEVGIQNAALAIVIGVSLLKHPDYAISAGVYGVTMYIGSLLLAMLAKKD
ncbi:bile acid:sodium symporter family protein [Aliiglaciecola litoralis]|uniref:Bile acid:sodium symporter family protein n=1 Tax=Aliiglaciecola litoralis TaxID=582857 RepID=A0ABP3WVP0_9ALTE